MKKAFMAVVLFAAQVLMFDVVPAQAASAPTLPDLDVQLMRADLRSQKKQIVAQNMLLTDTEAEKFWPVYDQYAAETIKINDARFEFIKQYAERYDSMTDADANVLIKKWLEADAAAVQLRLKYIP